MEKDILNEKAGVPSVDVKAPEKASKVVEVKVRLLAHHTHEGIEYDEGDIVEMDEASADYVVNKAKTGVRV